jgi:hypothetical protein
MPESPRRVDLRLTIPAAAPYRAVAAELAEKFAEFLGAKQAAAKSLGEALAGQVASLADSQPVDAAILIDMAAEDGQVVVTANAGSTTRRTTCPLPD